MLSHELIGLSGLARSGKDTAAQHLIKTAGFVQYSFAYPIKDVFDDLHAWGHNQREGSRKEIVSEFAFSQSFMFDILQERFGDYLESKGVITMDLVEQWLSILEEKNAIYTTNLSKRRYIAKYSPRQAYQWFGTELMRDRVSQNIWIDMASKFCDSNIRVVVPDVRFNNEADFIHSRHGLLMHIDRDGIQGAVNAHASEAGIDPAKIDVSIKNDATIEAMLVQVSLNRNAYVNSPVWDNNTIILSEN